MQLHHDLTVPASADDVWHALGEIDAIAPCLPGASVERVDHETVYGSMTVKVGPITVAYKGRAVIDERDDAGHRMVVHASGREQRGAGTAQATMVVAVHERPSGDTEVDVDTDLTVTGRPAQFGRGVMTDIGDRVVAEFADRLSRQLAANAGERRAEAGAGPSAGAGHVAGDGQVAGDGAAAATGQATEASAESEVLEAAERAASGEEAPAPQAGRDEPLDIGPILFPFLRRAVALAAMAIAMAIVRRQLKRRLRALLKAR